MHFSYKFAHFVHTNIVLPPQACSNLDGSDYVFPAAEKLMKYKIIVTTLITAGR